MYRWVQIVVSPLRVAAASEAGAGAPRAARIAIVGGHDIWQIFSETWTARGVGAVCPIASYFHDTIIDKTHIVRSEPFENILLLLESENRGPADCTTGHYMPQNRYVRIKFSYIMFSASHCGTFIECPRVHQ